jgi:hypothetical protein
MIRYALACAKGHSFESWFPNSAAYDKQAKRGLVTCPVCGDSKVEKAIMAPKLSGTRKRGKASTPVAAATRPAVASACMRDGCSPLSRFATASPTTAFTDRSLPLDEFPNPGPGRTGLATPQHVHDGLQLAEELEHLPVQVRLDVVVDVLPEAPNQLVAPAP